MAGTRITSGTLVAATVTTLTFVARYEGVRISASGTGDIYARTDGVAPTVAGDDCEYIASGQSYVVPNQAAEDDPGRWPATANPGTTVKLISSGTPTFTVTGVN